MEREVHSTRLIASLGLFFWPKRRVRVDPLGQWFVTVGRALQTEGGWIDPGDRFAWNRRMTDAFLVLLRGVVYPSPVCRLPFAVCLFVDIEEGRARWRSGITHGNREFSSFLKKLFIY